jgi:hypothetical protein
MSLWGATYSPASESSEFGPNKHGFFNIRQFYYEAGDYKSWHLLWAHSVILQSWCLSQPSNLLLCRRYHQLLRWRPILWCPAWELASASLSWSLGRHKRLCSQSLRIRYSVPLTSVVWIWNCLVWRLWLRTHSHRNISPHIRPRSHCSCLHTRPRITQLTYQSRWLIYLQGFVVC